MDEKKKVVKEELEMKGCTFRGKGKIIRINISESQYKYVYPKFILFILRYVNS